MSNESEIGKEMPNEGQLVGTSDSAHNKVQVDQIGKDSSPIINVNNEPSSITVTTNIIDRTQIQETLLENEQKLKAIIQGLSISAFVIDSNHRVLYWNKALEALSNIRAEEIIGTTNHWKAFYSQKRPCMADILIDGALDGIEKWYAGRYKKSSLLDESFEATDFFPNLGNDGKWLQFTATIIRNTGRDLVGVLEILEDISERKIAEIALQESEKKYRTLLETTDTGFCILDSQGNVLDANSEYVRLSGHSSLEEILGRSVTEWTAEHNLQKNVEEIKKCIQQGFVRNLEIDYVDKHGKTTPIEINATVIYTDNNQRILTLCRDISERKRAEEALQEREEQFRATFEQAAVGIAQVAPEGRFLRVNQRLCDIVGYTNEELLTKSFQDITHPDDLLKDIAARHQLMVNEIQTYSREKRYIRKDGSSVWVNLTVSLLRGPTGAPKHFVSVIEDITKRKQAEEEVYESQERFKILSSITAEGIMVHEGGVIMDANQAFAELVGYSNPDNLVGKNGLEIIPFTSKSRQRVLARMRTGSTETYEIELAKSDGSILPAETHSRPITYRGRQARLISMRDITGRVKAEQALRDSENKFKRLFEGSAEAQILLNNEGLVVDCNDAMLRLFALKDKKTVEGHNPAEFAPEFQPDGTPSKNIANLILASVTEKGSAQFEWAHLKHDSERTPIMTEIICTLVPIQGHPFLHVSIRDITKRKKAEEEICWKTALLEAQVNTAIDGVLIVDTKGIKILQNKRCIDLWKIPKDIVANNDDKQQLEFVKNRTKDPEKFVERVAYLYAHPNEISRDEVEFKDGMVLDRYSAPVIGKDGTNFGRIWLFRDITERKLAEKKLQESEERYKKITEELSDYLYTVRVQDGRAIDTIHGEACEIVTGYSSQDFKVDPYLWISMIPEKERDQVRDCARRILAGKKINVMEHRIIRKDGQVRWVLDTPILHFDGQGHLISYDGVIKDITERKNAEEKLRETQERYQSLFDRSLELVYLCDFQGNFIDANPAALKLLGYTKEELTSLTFNSIIDQEQLAQAFQVLETMKMTGYQSQPIEYKLRSKNGQDIYIETVSSLVYQDGKPVAIQGTARDITQQKLADERLKEANRVVTEMNAELEQKVKRRTEQIEILLKQKDEFIQMLAHDLKNPLVPLVTLLPIIEKKEQDLKQKELLQVVLVNARIIKELVEKTIILAVLSEPSIQFTTKSVSLRSEAEKVINIHKTMFQEHHMIIENHIQENLVADAEPLRLQEIFDNLFTNAVKFSPMGGKIMLDARTENDMVLISVKDTGIGITAEHMHHIFEEFYKADTSRHDLDSSGLGLPICKRIVEKHGGKIWAESPGKDKGTTFFFTLPFVKKA